MNKRTQQMTPHERWAADLRRQERPWLVLKYTAIALMVVVAFVVYRAQRQGLGGSSVQSGVISSSGPGAMFGR